VLPTCPFCERAWAGAPAPSYAPCPHPCFRFITKSQPGGEYAYHALGVDIKVGFPAAGDVIDIDRAIVAILARHYVLAGDVWFAESEEAVRAAHRDILAFLDSLESVVIV
jgi:hypothetical protein